MKCPMLPLVETFANGVLRMPDSLFRVGRWNKEGDCMKFLRQVGEYEFSETFCISVEGVTRSVDASRSEIRFDAGAVEWLKPLYALRKDLRPERNPLVEQWLNDLGGADSKHLLAWVAHALRFNVGLPSLFVKAASGAGKSTLAYALANTIAGSKGFVRSTEYFSTSQSSIYGSPFIVAEEGLRGRDHKEITRELKESAGLVTLSITEKYKPTVKLRVAPRWILTANKLSDIATVLREFESSLDRTNAEAVGRRIIFVRPNPNAAESISRVRDAYSNAEEIIGRHILWMNENPERFAFEGQTCDQRWAVSGNLHTIQDDIEDEVVAAGANHRSVQDIIIAALDDYAHSSDPQHHLVDRSPDGTLSIAITKLVDYARGQGGRDATIAEFRAHIKAEYGTAAYGHAPGSSAVRFIIPQETAERFGKRA